MNPAEKVKTILDGLTVPMSKDDPFNTGGRKTIFDSSCNDLHTLTFQAFVNRISTFKPECWSSDPNAAIFLAKCGFKTVSGCKVCCCSCGVEVDLGVFLGKRDVLRTLALKSHKQYCRWVHVSTPQGYFTIPRNPHRSLQDLKITFTEMITFQSNLPLILKDNWLKMGISEAFMVSALSFLEHTYSDLFASCVVLSLCGWVKRNEKSLQCNFCQRVVGVWNFISDNVKRTGSQVPNRRSSKHSRVISLLYSEIRRSMESRDGSGIVDVDCERTTEPTSQQQNVLGSAEVSEPNQEEETGPNPLCENECTLEGLEETPVQGEQNLTEESEGQYVFPSLHATWNCKCKKQISSKSNETRIELSSLNSGNSDEIVAWEPGLNQRTHLLKKKAWKYMWCQNKRVKQKLAAQTMKLQREPNGNFYIINYAPRRGTQADRGKKGYKKICSIGGNEKNKGLTIVEFQSNNNGALSDENIFYDTEPNVREETCSQSIKSNNSAYGHGTIVIDSNSGVRSKETCNSTNERDSDPDNKCSPCLVALKKYYGRECVVELEKLDPKVSYKHDTSTAHLNQLENSCDIRTNSHNETDGRRKRKRVPECDRNGGPYNSGLLPRLPAQMEPAHFTRSKKKELEMMLSERSKSTKVQSSKDNGTEIIEISSEGEAASENESKPVPIQEECGGNDKHHDIMKVSTCNTKGSENNPVILSNHEDNAELAPVIFSVVGNAVIPDTSEEEMDEYVDGDKQVPKGPIIVSTQTLLAGEPPDIYSGRCKNCNAKSHSYEDYYRAGSPLSSSPEKSVSDGRTDGKSYEASEETSSEGEDRIHSPRRKKRRIESNVNSSVDRFNTIPDLDDLINDLPPSYFHPELEHRYWCIWRIQVAECLKQCYGWKKGWELYMAAIQKGLELQNAEKVAVCEVENNALGCLADIVTLTKQRKK